MPKKTKSIFDDFVGPLEPVTDYNDVGRLSKMPGSYDPTNRLYREPDKYELNPDEMKSSYMGIIKRKKDALKLADMVNKDPFLKRVLSEKADVLTPEYKGDVQGVLNNYSENPELSGEVGSFFQRYQEGAPDLNTYYRLIQRRRDWSK